MPKSETVTAIPTPETAAEFVELLYGLSQHPPYEFMATQRHCSEHAAAIFRSAADRMDRLLKVIECLKQQ